MESFEHMNITVGRLINTNHYFFTALNRRVLFGSKLYSIAVFLHMLIQGKYAAQSHKCVLKEFHPSDQFRNLEAYNRSSRNVYRGHNF
jgi:hypothetical protein